MRESATKCVPVGVLVEFVGMEEILTHTPAIEGEQLLLAFANNYYDLEEDISLILLSLLVLPSSKSPMAPLVPPSSKFPVPPLVSPSSRTPVPTLVPPSSSCLRVRKTRLFGGVGVTVCSSEISFLLLVCAGICQQCVFSPFMGASALLLSFFFYNDDDVMSIAASQGGLESSGDEDSAVSSGVPVLPKSDPELTAMLSRAATSIGHEWNPLPCPERSRLDDWFLGVESPRKESLIPFFPEVHEEVMRSWKSPLTPRDRSSTSSAFSALDETAAKVYTGVPSVESSVAMQLCPQSASTWCGDPKHPSKACRFSSTLVAKAYRAVGQAASSLHAMAILQVYQARVLRDMHEGRAHPGLSWALQRRGRGLCPTVLGRPEAA
ncbi:hypothetical protein PO909_004552 [Leuciscus waleckii]